MLTDLRQYDALQQVNAGYWFDPEGVLHGENVTWAPIPENNTQPTIIPHSAILHSNGGPVAATWQNLRGFMGTDKETKECHFDVDNSGQAGQFMSVLRRADCNFDANLWMYNGKAYGAISIETGDHGAKGLDTTGWNFAQLATLSAILTAAAVQYEIGCNEVLRWDGKGIDYHTKFPYLGPGIKAWTNVAGKTCPGKQRKLQTPFLRNEVATRVGNYMNKCAEIGVPHGLTGL